MRTISAKNAGDENFGNTDTLLLYQQLNAKEGNHPLRECNLKTVIINLVKGALPNNNNLEMSAMIH